MANQWFRLYPEILNDSKVQILTEALRWRYVALLCLHCNGGYQNTPDDEVALSLRVTLDEWIFTKAELIKRRLLKDNGDINGWEKRQYISDLKDPTAAERQKRYRDNKRNDRNASVTSRLPESETETETDTETDTEAEKEEKKNKQKEKSAKPPDKKKILEMHGIAGQLAADFIEHRKSRKATITETVMQGFAREAIKAGISTAEAVSISIERNWQGFKAEWHQEQSGRVVALGSQRPQTIAEKNSAMLRKYEAEIAAERAGNGNIIEGVVYARF